MADRSHLSIGEVLSLLQDEFPDVTISKIRFLESQGLMDPERTPSGYRKFYEADIEKLRWVLRQQRENFLPLKVIKDRLDEHGGKIPPDEPTTAAPAGQGRTLAAAAPPAAPTTGSLPFVAPDETEPPAPGSTEPVWMQDHARRAAARGAGPAPAPDASRTRPATPEKTTPPAEPPDSGSDVSTVSLTEQELVRASGLSVSQLRSLEQFGLVVGRQVGPDVLYDSEAVVVAQKAVEFLSHGIEARHLRMFKVAAEREAGFLEQVVTPLLKQRNPGSRQQAVQLLHDLIGLGDAIHAALLRHALRDYLHPPG